MGKKKKILIILGCVAGTIAVAYGIGCYYYNGHFMPNTVINGNNVSNDELNTAKEVITNPPLSFTVKERNDTEETISLNSIDYEISVNISDVYNLMKGQNAFAWPSYLFKTSEYHVDTQSSYDRTSLENEIKQLKALDSSAAVQPVDAYIDKQNDAYVIVPEVNGTLLDEDKTIQAIENKVSDGETEVDLDAEGCYVNPNITSEDETLNGHLRALVAMNNESFIIDLGGGATEELSGEQLADMVTVDEAGNVTVLDDQLDAYVQNLADQYNTMCTTRSFTTHSGSVISVGTSKDTYGYLMNQASTEDALKQAIESKQSQTVSAYYDVSAVTRNGVNGDIGNTYIEVSLSEQHLWYYENGALVMETDVITGNPTYNQDTPSGVFRVWAKQRNATLKGKNLDGTDYESPVSYWMPIDWTGVGLHDASWQSAFGGNLLYTRGSHGCVNLPPSFAANLFNAIALNTPVIIY